MKGSSLGKALAPVYKLNQINVLYRFLLLLSFQLVEGIAGLYNSKSRCDEEKAMALVKATIKEEIRGLLVV